MKIILFLLALALYIDTPACRAEPVTLLGAFDNVTSQDDGEHCAGYSVTLWRSGMTVLGLLDQHEGLCGDPPCAMLDKPTYDPGTGALTFKSKIDGTNLSFIGAMKDVEVSGTMNGEVLELKRQRDSAAQDYSSLAKWCSFWSAIPRCHGIKLYCQHAITSDGSGQKTNE